MHTTTMARRRFLGVGAAVATPAGRRRTLWPDLLNLPNGFHPAGIGICPGLYAYFGSLLGGAVHRTSQRTGEGKVINPGLGEGYYAVGLQVDEQQRVFVASGWGRLITVMGGITGKVVGTYEVGNADTFVDHVVLTPRAAWFTDSFNGQLFGLPLGPRRALLARDEVVTLRLGGEWTQGPSDGLTATGIAATPDGSGSSWSTSTPTAAACSGSTR
ncbi:hypothetical protein [Streptomyces atroolivaceus]|uniref:hypothetical protein n=1 Tax=Streptomyces atroolivaceus TaxID=66869 RepID=UPI0037AB8934